MTDAPKKNKTLIITTVVLLLLILVSAGGYFYINSALSQTVSVKRTQLITVKKGQTLNQLCQQFAAKNMVSNCLAIKLYSKVFDTYTGIKSGIYELKPNQEFQRFLKQVVMGDVKQYNFTIIEGENLYQVLDKLESATSLNNDLSGKTHKQVAQVLELDSESAEGWLYPETYSYPAGSKASDMLKRAVVKQQSLLQQEWQSRLEDLPLNSPYEALILASIIEKESSVAGERDKVSSVFHNRLNIGMRLQTDPTVIYGVWDEYKGDITRQHMRDKNAYNTYRINGLPPTPIANPSLASLQAVLHPAKTDYFYFVASGEGDHVFSKTLEQHNRALRNYLRKQRLNKLKENNG